jgi:hypothetical protein
MRGVLAALLIFVTAATAAAQQGAGRVGAPPRGRGGPAVPATPQAAAPIDFTGNWVAVISEDWRWRMVTPGKGEYASIPITQAAKDVADQWDPAKDEASGEVCKSYGAPGVMRAPTRLRISWQDERTLKVETDYGMQTRLLSFVTRQRSPMPSWQGDSLAQWERPAGRGPVRGGNLKVVTTNLRPGYLRKNGVPYSADATYTEYWDVFTGVREPLLVITSVVRDPKYLQIDWITSLHFRKEPNGDKWDPTPCSTTW